jgi:hypothetical protein
MDDAGARVSRYLVMQLCINATYGACVAVGLYFIGVPNAVLWGTCATLLRFIPYVGPWMGAAVPVALSLAVSPGWVTPLLTLILFIVLELLSNNVMEPWLYGTSTGVSPIALIFAAAFWAWLWGPAGLVLATPLTVCLVVMGRHIPRLSFLSVALSDQEALSPAEECYHRLLTVGEQDEMQKVETYLHRHSLASLYDSVLIPVLTAVEIDHRLGLLDHGQHALLEQSLRDIVDDLGASPPAAFGTETDTAVPGPTPCAARRVYCLPARAVRDDLAGSMLGQLLRRRGVDAQNAPCTLGVQETIALVEGAAVDVVCISVVPPSTVLHARHLCLKLRRLLPRQRILVGLWGATEDVADASRRVRDSGANDICTTLEDAVSNVLKPATEPVVGRPRLSVTTACEAEAPA